MSLWIKSQPTASTQLPTDYRHTDKYLRLVQSWEHWLTDRWTDGRYQVHYLPASRSIKIPDVYYFYSYLLKLKADWPQLPTDYRHTDKYFRLVQPRERWQTDRRTDGRVLPSTLSPSFAVDKNPWCRWFLCILGISHSILQSIPKETHV